MHFRSILVIVALALPGAALAQGKGGQSKASGDLPACDLMPDGTETLACTCPAGFTLGDVWGAGPYTGDSDICTAALHSGAITAEGGDVNVLRAAALASYPGGSANGITTSAWDGSYDFSIRVVAAGSVGTQTEIMACADLPSDVSGLCACPSSPPLQTVWGSGPYTGDSDICTAAIHSGVIGKAGGPVRIERRPGQDSYAASTINGVATEGWGSYGESFIVVAASTATDPFAGYPDIGMCSGLPDMEGPVVCTCDSVTPRSVWGSGPYTGDSDVCTAAVHAGVINTEGGRVLMTQAPGADSYDGSVANGVTTRGWGSYGNSFEILPTSPGGDATLASTEDTMDEPAACSVLPDGVDAYTCECGRGLARGDVWGAGPYTSDSDICTAARHAGVIRSFGGEVRVLRIQGLPFYASGADNGVSTAEWGEAFESSIVFDRN